MTVEIKDFGDLVMLSLVRSKGPAQVMHVPIAELPGLTLRLAQVVHDAGEEGRFNDADVAGH